VTGSVTSGHFCDTPSRAYTLYFAAQFDRPFTSSGLWNDKSRVAGRLCAGARAATCGAWVGFDTRHNRTVAMKVGVSFVSVAGARANLNAENRDWNVAGTQRRARGAWNDLLGHIRVAGGTLAERRTFYTALYHSLLHPNVFSDVDGRYIGFDDRVHRNTSHAQYANISDWDIYRSEVPLLALVAPRQTSDMMQSLVNDAAQGGWLPKWPVANAYTDEMNGDSSDPILASAYAFGARNFDARAALAAMVRGATEPGAGQGWAPERQDLAEYLARGWVHSGSRDLTSSDYTVGGSETVEYAIDDFAISRFARQLGDGPTAARFARRGNNWQHLFNPATRYLSARHIDGRFPPGPAFQPSSHQNLGQDGWEEGNSIQYSWSVPQDLRGLFDRMGGNAVVVGRLDTFFAQLNAGRRQPNYWAGNEPNLGTPWEYDYAGAPYRTQDVVRRITLELYADSPNGEPGNDDLGAMSSWYVWAAIGLYPETPGSANLVMASPLFTSVTLQLPRGRPLVIRAPAASDPNRYVRAATLNGHRYTKPWLPESVLRDGAELQLALASTPNTAWGATPSDAPPSYG
jgi:predicted alpha-1,2-mannosidase